VSEQFLNGTSAYYLSQVNKSAGRRHPSDFSYHGSIYWAKESFHSYLTQVFIDKEAREGNAS